MNETILDFVLNELVIANRVLANEGVVDAYRHVSARHSSKVERFFMARMLATELVERGDLMEFGLDGQAISDSRAPSVERFIHGAIYEARPEVQGVVHAHAEDVLPFGITDAQLRPVIHSGSFIGLNAPVCNIAETFGHTHFLFRAISQGLDLAPCLDKNNVVLIRGLGFAAVAGSLIEVVGISVSLPRNARVQLAAMQIGKYKPLS